MCWNGKPPSSKEPFVRRCEPDLRPSMQVTHLRDPAMSKADKGVVALKQKRETIEGGDVQRDVARPRGAARTWATVNKLHVGGKTIDARRNVPSGPMGGSGRKTNQSRTS